MSHPVFLCPAAADARPGDVLRLDGQEARHAVTVQRRAVGEIIDLVDGAGVRARGPIVEASPAALAIEVAAVTLDNDPPVVLVQALAKSGRDEQAVEAATELGVTTVIPWAAARSIVQWKGPKAAKGKEGWQQVALAAAKQSRRAVVPAVGDVVTTAQLVTWISEQVASGAAVLVLHEEATAAIATIDWTRRQGPVAVIVGPEGGIGDEELGLLTQAGALATVLGPHVLRASSAGPAALAALAAMRGHWGTRPTTLEP